MSGWMDGNDAFLLSQLKGCGRVLTDIGWRLLVKCQTHLQAVL